MSYFPTTPTIVSGDTVNAPCNNAVYNGLAGKQPTGNYITALTGQVTASGPGSVAATIATNTVSNSNLAQVVTQTFKGRTTAGTGNVEDLTTAQATALLNQFSSSLQGVVPASGGGTANFLRADGTWAAAGVSPGTAEYILYTNSAGTGTEWAINGRGPSGSSYPTNSIVLGRVKPVGMSAQNTVLVGVGANAGSANDSVAIGYNAYANDRAVAIGSGASVTNNANGYQSVAVGYSATATGEAGVTVGSNATGNRNSTVIGYSASCAGLGVVIGREASNTAQGSIVIGRSAASASTGAIAIGYQANSGNSSSTNAVVIGYNSGQSGLSGTNNTVVGTASFNNASLTTAYDCTIVGKGAGTTLTTGFSCVLVGSGATCGATNEDAIAIGNNATGANFGIAIGKGNTTSSEGVTIGSAGRAGSESVSVGRYAGYYNNGSQSVAIGVRSNAGNTLGTTVGYRAGGVSFSGTYTNGTHIGAYSGNALTTGSSNVFLGYYSGGRSTTQSNELFIDNQDRTTYAAQQTGSILYGVMSATASSQTLTTNSAFTATYGLNVSTVGYGLSVKGGSNAKIGIATFSGVSSVTVSTTAVTANSIILVATQSGGYATMVVNNIVAGTSFDIQHNNTFTGTVGWFIVERS